MANDVLTKFQENPNSWTKVIQILQQSSSHQTKIFALQILNQTIRFKWNILPTEQQSGMKNFLIRIIIQMAKNETSKKDEHLLLLKFNECLIQIVKKEWPDKWPKFIPEIVESSKDSESLCENNMRLLKLLSEEVFEFSTGNLTKQKTNQLQQAYMSDFMSIFHLCEHILQKATKESLILETLQTLQRFICWIPLPFIFETNLIQQLVSKFLPVKQFRNDTMRCLADIVSPRDSNKTLPNQYEPQLRRLYSLTITTIADHILPPKTNIPEGYENGDDEDQKFIQVFGLFLSNCFESYLRILEIPEISSQLKLGHEYLLQISNVDDAEIFKTALDYWRKLTSELFNEQQSAPRRPLSMNSGRLNFYGLLLSNLRYILVTKMTKPEEVIIVEDENGNLVKERYTNVASIELYNTMKRCLIYLTKLDSQNMEAIMTSKLETVQHKNWSWNNLNTLCWAIGSISGHMNRDQENRFLVNVIKALLELTDQTSGKPNKAVVASNIMYVVGQYPTFLNQHFRFLQTVVYKLFEFMHEDFEGVQEMACETYLKICSQCSHRFVEPQGKDSPIFSETIVNDLSLITSDLKGRELQTFYEAMGYIIYEAKYNPNLQLKLLEGLMVLMNKVWAQIIEGASKNIEFVKNTHTMNDIVRVLQINVAVCKTSKGCFEQQISRIFNDMFEIYKIYSQLISQEVSAHGVIATKYSHVKLMASVKKEVLRLMETFFNGTEDLNLLSNKFVPPLLHAILTDYYNSVPDAKDASVLSLLYSAIKKLKQSMAPHLVSVLKSVMESTIPMIKENFNDYPDHRKNLFQLLNVINQECFQVFFQINASDFQLIMKSVLWAIMHDNRQSYETGLEMLDSLLTNIHSKNQEIVDPFYKAFFTTILTDIFGVLTDTMHMSGFKFQSSILRKLILVVNSNQLRVPLYDKGDSFSDNRGFAQTFIAEKIRNAFPNLSREEIQQFVINIFQNAGDETKFTDTLRDFLVVSKEWSNIDTKELYFEEREREAEQLKKEERDLAQSIS